MLCHLYFELQDQEKKDGVTSTGKPVTDTTTNTEGEKCTKCDKVGESLFVCTVSLYLGGLIFIACLRGAHVWFTVQRAANFWIGGCTPSGVGRERRQMIKSTMKIRGFKIL